MNYFDIWSDKKIMITTDDDVLLCRILSGYNSFCGRLSRDFKLNILNIYTSIPIKSIIVITKMN